MEKSKEINKLIIQKIREANTSNEIKSFLEDIFVFEREYYNEDLIRYSSHYKKLADYYIENMGDRK